MTFNQLVANILKTDVSNIKPESNAQTINGWDSLQHIRLVLAVERAYRVQFSVIEIANMQKIGDFIELLYTKGVDPFNEVKLEAV